MNGKELFFTRYDVLYSFWLHIVWEDIPGDLMRIRPGPAVNSIVWNLWHLTRVEDSALNRFIANRSQVLDDGDWMEKMNIPLRHNGFGMTFQEVDELSDRINLVALRGYSDTVEARTREILERLDFNILSEVLQEDKIRKILFDEGLAGPNSEGLLETYIGWTKGQFLMNHGLTHSYHHIGEINVITSLHGLVT